MLKPKCLSVTPVTHTFPYQPDAILQLFGPMSHRPWAMLLHSGFAQHTHNRFDILVADPLATLTTKGLLTTIRTASETIHSTDDPLQLLQQQIAQNLPTITSHPDFPFQGGAMGSFSYDLGRHFERLPSTANRDIQLPEMAVGIYDWAVIADHHQKTLTLLCHGDLQQRLNWLNTMSIRPPHASFKLQNKWRSNISQADYADKFACVQNYLRNGDCYQVNLTQRFQATYCGDEWDAFLTLIQTNQAPFSAFLRLPEHAVLSLSPERFIQLKSRQIQTRPIKGTRPRFLDAEQDRQAAQALSISSKDRAENVMIIDLLRNDIGRIATPGSVKVPELFKIESFPAVHHLVSTIIAELASGQSPTDLLRACFPGGSVTGAPKIRAMEIIEELEPQQRSLYCGSIGYISCCGTMDTSITIRTLLAEQGQLYCWTGGGIVADSQVTAEYQETLDKVARILPLLGEVDWR